MVSVSATDGRAGNARCGRSWANSRSALPSFSIAAATPGLTPAQISAIDAAHLWHPYSTIGAEAVPPVVAVGARGAWLTLIRDGKPIQVLDTMSSWWTAIHGHGHPDLDAALTAQLNTMNHVMFGGLTHEPAARLAQLLVDTTPAGLQTVFFCDSGSVSVEVAVKMALQYWRSRAQPGKRRLMTWRGGYHGDTFTPMSICDPDGGIHTLWTDILAQQVFALQVPRKYDPAYSAAFEEQLTQHATELAAVVVEPVVQGAGGMRFHDPRYLHDVREICRRHDVLLIFDEIATGFGRTGELFAADHAGVSPDNVYRQGTNRWVPEPGRHLVQHRYRTHHQFQRSRRADARAHIHGQPAGLRGVDRQRGSPAQPGLAVVGCGHQRRADRRSRAGAGVARGDRGPRVRGHRCHRMRPPGRPGGRHTGGAGPRGLATAVPQLGVRHAGRSSVRRPRSSRSPRPWSTSRTS
jgi:Aminotransferase class-III